MTDTATPVNNPPAQPVPMFDDAGTLRDVPYARVQEAMQHGFKPSVKVQFPDDNGQSRFVPADKLMEATHEHQATVVPMQDQPTDHPGVWGAVKSYLSGIGNIESGPQIMQRMQKDPESFNHIPKLPTPEENAQRKAEGLGPTYRALVPVAEAVGMNVKGAEKAGGEGDVGGVLGYAAVPAALAATSLLRRGAKPAPEEAAPQPVAAPREAPAPVQPATPAPVPEVAAPEVPAAKAEAAPAQPKVPAKVLRQSQALKPSPLQQAAALKQPVNDIVDDAISPDGETRGTNMLTKAKIDFHLQRGDVQGAQEVLDQATGKKSDFPPDAPKVVPSVQNIRENAGQAQAAEAQPRRYGSQDAMDDRALGQEMNWNLQKHGFMAESEARREFIANNSTGMTKGELNRQFDAAAGKPAVPDKPVKYTKTPGVNAVDPDEDLTDLLKKSLAAARAKKR